MGVSGLGYRDWSAWANVLNYNMKASEGAISFQNPGYLPPPNATPIIQTISLDQIMYQYQYNSGNVR